MATPPTTATKLDDLLKRAAITARRSRATNTLRTYGYALRAFAKFAVKHEQKPFPASTMLVAAFLQSQIDAGLSPASLELALTAIRNAHRAENQPDPTDDARVRAIAQGYRRLLADQGKRSKQVKGLSEDGLAAITAAAAMDDDIRSIRDIAVVTLLREGLLRRGECAALRVRDFSRETDGSGRLRITRSKTDQSGAGSTLFLGKEATDRVVKWLDAAPADSDAPLFRWIRRGGHIQSSGLSGASIHKIVRERGEAAGIEGLGGHAGRVGMAQSLVSSGASIAEIAIAGRWKSIDMVVHYASCQEANRSAVAKFRQAQDSPARGGRKNRLQGDQESVFPPLTWIQRIRA